MASALPAIPSYVDSVKVGTHTDSAVVSDEVLITGRGVGAAAYFSAEIISRIKSADVADSIMRATVQIA